MKYELNIENNGFYFLSYLMEHPFYKSFFDLTQDGFEILKLHEIHATEKKLSAFVTVKELKTGDEKNLIINGFHEKYEIDKTLELTKDIGVKTDGRLDKTYLP